MNRFLQKHIDSQLPKNLLIRCSCQFFDRGRSPHYSLGMLHSLPATSPSPLNLNHSHLNPHMTGLPLPDMLSLQRQGTYWLAVTSFFLAHRLLEGLSNSPLYLAVCALVILHFSVLINFGKAGTKKALDRTYTYLNLVTAVLVLCGLPARRLHKHIAGDPSNCRIRHETVIHRGLGWRALSAAEWYFQKVFARTISTLLPG